MIICCGLVNHFWICFGRFGEQPAKKVVWFVFLNPTVDNQFWSTACFIHMKFRVLTPQNYWRLIKLGGFLRNRNILCGGKFADVVSVLLENIWMSWTEPDIHFASSRGDRRSRREGEDPPVWSWATCWRCENFIYFPDVTACYNTAVYPKLLA